MQKSCRKYAPTASPRPLFYFGKIQNSHCMQETPLKIRYFKKRLSKIIKKLTLFFLSKPVPFNEQSYQKQKGPGTSDPLLFRL